LAAFFAPLPDSITARFFDEFMKRIMPDET